ncbi:MAG: hypothetical protein ACL93V_05555 [Candidatus Electrothrix sp. YB6]
MRQHFRWIAPGEFMWNDREPDYKSQVDQGIVNGRYCSHAGGMEMETIAATISDSAE